MRLYKIDEEDIKTTIKIALLDISTASGKYEKINYSLSEKIRLSIKGCIFQRKIRI